MQAVLRTQETKMMPHATDYDLMVLVICQSMNDGKGRGETICECLPVCCSMSNGDASASKQRESDQSTVECVNKASRPSQSCPSLFVELLSYS